VFFISEAINAQAKKPYIDTAVQHKKERDSISRAKMLIKDSFPPPDKTRVNPKIRKDSVNKKNTASNFFFQMSDKNENVFYKLSICLMKGAMQKTNSKRKYFLFSISQSRDWKIK